MIDLITNELTFSRNTRHLSHTSKELYSWIREERQRMQHWVRKGWVVDSVEEQKDESWLAARAHEERPFWVQMRTLIEKRIDDHQYCTEGVFRVYQISIALLLLTQQRNWNQ